MAKGSLGVRTKCSAMASEGGDGRLALRRGSVVSQAPEGFTKNFMFFYIAYKDSLEKGRKILVK